MRVGRPVCLSIYFIHLLFAYCVRRLFAVMLTDGLIGWLVWLINWFADLLVDHLVAWLISRFGRLASCTRFVGVRVGLLVVCRLVVRVLVYLVGYSTARFV